MSENIIEVEGLRKSYDGVDAVRGIDLAVAPGQVFAFLGPNGAGKTTTVEILEGYRSRQAGRVSVLGADPATTTRAWREHIGIVLQESELEPTLTVRETLALYAGYYRAPRDVGATIDLVGLAAKAEVRAGRLSGGQRRRLDVAVALVGDPELLFLDEPTTGFDPSARRQAWEVIASLKGLGKTVFLTTHYMDEAQALADRVAIIAAGRIVAEGTPAELGGRGDAGATIAFTLPADFDLARLPIAPSSNGSRTAEFETREPVRVLYELTGWALREGVTLTDLEVRRPSLEDTYLRLVADAEGEAR